MSTFLIALGCATWLAPAARADDTPPPSATPPAEPAPAASAAVATPEEPVHKDPLCVHAVGIAGGAYVAGAEWQRLGQGSWAPTASPVLAGACGRNLLTTVHPWIGVETAPFYSHTRMDGATVDQFATATVGVLFGDGMIRVGPHGTAGWTALGTGLTAVLAPTNDKGFGAIELRATWFHLGADGFQGMLLYDIYPRGKRGAS
jgi:hypothetical protein